MFFNYTTGFHEYATMSKNFAKHIPNAQLDALLLDDSSHTDQGDVSVYNSFINSLLFNRILSKCSFTKKGGNHTQYYEYLACLWLNFLHRIGNHDNTFTTEPFIEKRISQFEYAVRYNHKMETNDKKGLSIMAPLEVQNHNDNYTKV